MASESSKGFSSFSAPDTSAASSVLPRNAKTNFGLGSSTSSDPSSLAVAAKQSGLAGEDSGSDAQGAVQTKGYQVVQQEGATSPLVDGVTRNAKFRVLQNDYNALKLKLEKQGTAAQSLLNDSNEAIRKVDECAEHQELQARLDVLYAVLGKP